MRFPFRYPMKTALLLFLSLTVATASFAADTKPIEDVFQSYWSAYARKDFAKAAAEVLPSDLEETKAVILPLFLSAQTHKSKEVQDIVTAFFGRAVGKSREGMTAVDVYAGLNRVIMAGSAEFFEVLKDAKTTVIFVRTPEPEQAEVHFQVTIRGESDTDSETLTKKNGRWWVRVKDDPKDVAAQFKAMLAQQG